MAQVDPMPQQHPSYQGPMGDRGRSRVVYLEDELSEGDDEDFDFGFLSDEHMENINIPGLCSSNNCSEQAFANTYADAEIITQELCTQADDYRCDPQSMAENVAWPPQQQYQYARPRSDSGDSGDSIILTSPGAGGGDYRKGSEKFNYAKALLDSEEELGRLSLKIRSEIRHAEMIELAVEAERAAEAGEEKFSGQASTFAGDSSIGSLKERTRLQPSKGSTSDGQLKELQQQQRQPPPIRSGSGRLHLRRNSSSYTEGIIPLVEKRKIPVLALRNITDVIPQWSELHSHMRTHLARRNVDEVTLVYQEVEGTASSDDREGIDGGVDGASHDSGDTRSVAQNFARQSMNFLGNITDLSMLQLAAQHMDLRGPGHPCNINDPETVGSLICEDKEDNESQGSNESSKSDQFGTTLSSHLSPLDGQVLKRPKVGLIPGLTLPETPSRRHNIRIPDKKEDGNTQGLQGNDLGMPTSLSNTSKQEDKHPLSLPVFFSCRRDHAHADADGAFEDQGGNLTIDTVDTTSSSGSFRRDDAKKCDSVGGGDDVSITHHSMDASTMVPIALFDAIEDECVSSCPPSPELKLPPFSKTDSSTHHNMMPEPMLTPKENESWSKLHGSADFVTPARLREMRTRRRHHDVVDNHQSSTTRNVNSDSIEVGNVTPESRTFSFEPSSIIDTGGSNDSGSLLEVSPLAADKAMLLALPSIQSLPNERYHRHKTHDAKDSLARRFNYPRPRTVEDEVGGLLIDVANPRHLETPIPEETSTQADSDYNPADSISLASSATFESISKALQRIEMDDPSELLDTNPLWSASKEKAIASKRSDDQDSISHDPKIDEQRQDVTSEGALSAGGNEESKEEHRSEVKLSGKEKDQNRCVVSTPTDDSSIGDAHGKLGPDSQSNFSGVERLAVPPNGKRSAESSVCPETNISCDCECLADNASTASSEGSQAEGPLHMSETWGGGISPEQLDFRRVMSWPNAKTEEEDSDDPVNHWRHVAVTRPPADVVCNVFAATTIDIISAGTENMCHRDLPRVMGPPSFQAAMDLLGKFSPTKEATDIYYPDSENQEFLNNYFYCGKPEEIAPPKRRHVNTEPCAEPCVANETFCTTMGVDNVCGGLNFLFDTDDPSRRASIPTATREQVLSVGPAREAQLDPLGTWMGVLDIAKFSFGKNDASENKKLFQPPCLKKTCTLTPRKAASPPPRIERKNSRDQTIDEAMGAFVDSLNRVHPDDPDAEAEFQSLYGVSRKEFASLEESDRWSLIEMVVDRKRKERKDRARYEKSHATQTRKQS